MTLSHIKTSSFEQFLISWLKVKGVYVFLYLLMLTEKMRVVSDLYGLFFMNPP